MPRISVKPGTAGYWRRCRDEIWLLHGEGALGKGENTFEIGRIVKRPEPFVMKVLTERREAARRAVRGAA